MNDNRHSNRLVLEDTFLYLRPVAESDNASVCRNYVEMLADVYEHISKPPQIATDWRRDVVPRLVRDVNLNSLDRIVHLPDDW